MAKRGRPKKLPSIAEDIPPDDLGDLEPLFPEDGVFDTESPVIPANAVAGMDVWTRAFLEAELSLHAPEAKAARMRVAWRITRALAIFQGRIDATQLLDDIKDPHIPRSLTQAVRDLLPINYTKQIHNDTTLSATENPEQIQRWLQAMEATAYMMNCSVLHEQDPRLGSQNFWGLLHPTYYKALFPSLMHLATYERKMLHKVLRFLIRKGPMRTYDWLRHRHLLTLQECKMLMSMARVEARSIVEYEQEEERAVMTLRLQDHQERSRREGNLREELQSMKQESIVRGLTATQPEGFGDVFARTVTTVAKRIDAQPTQLQLPAPRIQTDDESDTSESDED